MNARWVLVNLFFLSCFFAFAGGSLAQTYVFDAGGNNSYVKPQRIEKPTELKYMYGYLSQGEDKVDYYVLELTEFTSQMQIKLLRREEAVGFKPSLILVDPQQNTFRGEAPYGFPTNVGGRAYQWQEFTEKKHTDAVVFENLMQGPTISKDFSPGRYVLAIFDPQSRGGRYVLAVGTKKSQDTLLEKFSSFFALLRIKFNLY